MSKPDRQKELVDIQKVVMLVAQGLKKLGRNRVVALSAHKQWELTDALEEHLVEIRSKLQTLEE